MHVCQFLEHFHVLVSLQAGQLIVVLGGTLFQLANLAAQYLLVKFIMF